MSFIVLLTGMAGFLSSFLLLHAGVTRMVIRYPLAMGAAYAAFIACLWVWIRHNRLHSRRREGKDRSELDPFDFDVSGVQLPMGGEVPTPSFEEFGGGGGFSGGGGGSSWGGDVSAVKSSGGGVNIELDVDVGEGAVVVIPLLIAAAVATGAAVYVIYISPALFAELLLDVALSAGLYRRLKDDECVGWLTRAVRRTFVPAVFVTLLLAGAGWVMQSAYPQATSIGRVLERVQAKENALP